MLCFAFFVKNSKIEYDPHFWKIRVSLDTLLFENFDEIALSHMVREIQAFLCFTR